MDELQSDNVRKKRPPLSTHCDTPLTLNNARKALLVPAPGQFIHPNNPIRREYLEMQRQLQITPPNLFDLSKVQGFFLNVFNVPVSSLPLLEFRQALHLASQLYQVEVEGVLKELGASATKIDISPLMKNKDLINLYLRKCFWEEAVVMSGNDNSSQGSWWSRADKGLILFRRPGLDIIIGENLMSIQTSQNSILVSRDHLTILSDLAAERFSIILQSFLADQTHNTDMPTPSELSLFLKEGDEMLTLAGNQGYDLIYTLESSCTSRLVGNYEGGSWKDSKFRHEIVKDLGKKASDLNLHPQLRVREQLLDSVFERNLNAFTQLYGLYRIWGHPTLDPLLGTIALKELGTTPRLYLSYQAQEINNKFKEEFIKRYLNRHKEWPELDVSKLPRHNIIRVHYEKKLQFPFKSRQYKRSHLSLVEFKDVFPVDPKFDLIEFIDDKSISLGFPDLLNEIYRNKSIGNSLARSLLLNFLSSDISDPQEFLKNIDTSGFPPEEICVGVHEKEREGKLKARLFGLLTLVKRSYVVITEKLLAEHLFPYFPEITMTDDELVLEKKRHAFNTERKNKFMVSLDFSKWNTNMRAPDTQPFYHTIDTMFGLENCFTRTHEMFYNSFLYLIDGSYLPTIVDDGFKTDIGCWRHHLGGIEGLRQKGWTLWTVMLIRLVAEKYIFNMSIMGQGDNQMLLLTFDSNIPEEYALSQVNDFLQSLKDKLSLIGPPLKLEETWISKDFYLYGKYPIKGGVSLTTSWKKSCRMFRCCNEDYPTIESSLSSLAANLYSAVAADNFTQTLFFVYLFELVGLFQCNIRRPYLQKNSFYQSLDRNRTFTVASAKDQKKKLHVPLVLSPPNQLQPTEVLLGLCLTPRTLGGYPVVLYPSVLIKGAPDQLSFDLASLKLFSKSADATVNRIITRVSSPFLSEYKNYSLLFMNPEAINLESTPTPAEARRTTMLEFLSNSDRVKQPYIKEFLNIIHENANQSMEDFLTSNPVLHPRVISLLLQATPQYRAQQVIGRLQKTPTMARVYLREGDRDLYALLEMSELNHFKSVLRQVFAEVGRYSLPHFNSSVEHSTFLRNMGWGKIIEGVDSAPPHEVFHLEVMTSITECQDSPHADLGFISVRLNTPKDIAGNSLAIGTTRPYRGSITKNKVNSLSTKIQARTPSLLQRALMVAGLESWAFTKDSSLAQLSRGLVWSVTDLPYELLTPQVDQVSGSYQHRLRNDRLDNGGISPVLPNQGTKLQFNTVPLICLNKGSKNKNVMFQGPLVMFGSVIGEGLLTEGINCPETKLFHIHIRNPSSIQDLDENPITYPPIQQPIRLLRNPQSPFLFFPSDKIMPYIKRILKYPICSREDLNVIPTESRFNTLLAYECINLLDPWSWVSGSDSRLVTNGITINWALSCNIVELCLVISLLLLAIFFTPTKIIDPEWHINRVINVVKASPLSSWENLTNLCFCNVFPTPLLHFLRAMSPQTSEGLTNSNVALILKTSITLILQNILYDRNFIKGKVPHLIAPPAVSFNLHPYRVIEILGWLYKEHEVHKSHLSYLSKDMLDLKLRSLEGPYVHQLDSWGSPTRISGISSESLDYLCKLEDVIKSRSIEVLTVATIFDPNPLPMPLVTGPIVKSGVMNTRLQVSFYSEGDVLHPELGHRDYRTFFFRPAPLPTSGAYKLSSVLPLLGSCALTKCLCLADGTGGFTRTLALRDDSKTIVFNTLVTDQDYVTQMDPIQNIPDIADLPISCQKKVVGLREVNDYPTDITSPDFGHQILDRFGGDFILVTGDAEDPSLHHSGNVLALFKAYRDISLIVNSVHGIFKIHTHRRSVLHQALVILLTYYDSVVVVRSQFSLRSNNEFYLVGARNKLAPKILPLKIITLADGNPTLNVGLSRDAELMLNKSLNNLNRQQGQLQELQKSTYIQITSNLMPHLHYQDLIFHLVGQYPWLKQEYFDIGEFKDGDLRPIYSSCIHKFVTSIHKANTKYEEKDVARFVVKQFTLRELSDILSSYLFLILSVLPLARWNSWIPHFLKEGCLLWIQCENGLWFFSPYLGVVPPAGSTYHFRLYRTQDLLNHVAIQRICRSVGLAHMLHFREPDDKHLKEESIFTRPSRKFTFYDPKLKGLKDKIKCQSWQWLSQSPGYQLDQFARISQNPKK
nr:L [Spodoptera frugiperda rhabdovirus] [Spodoptera frugiperda rhabdovirus]